MGGNQREICSSEAENERGKLASKKESEEGLCTPQANSSRSQQYGTDHRSAAVLP